MKNKRLIFSFFISSSLLLALLIFMLFHELNTLEANAAIARDKEFEFGENINYPTDQNEGYSYKVYYKYIGKFDLQNMTNYFQCFSKLYFNGQIPFYTSSQNPNHTVKPNEVFSYTYSVPNWKSYSSNEITIQYGLYNTNSKTYLFSKTVNVFAIKKETINPNDYMLEPYQINNTVSDSGFIYSEKLLFDDFIDVLSLDKTHALNLTSLSFSYDYVLPFSYESARLTIYDKNSLFSKLYKDNNGNPYINLKAVVNDNRIYFEPNEEIFVDPISLEISSTKIDGYIQTNKIYLPRNKKSELEDYPFSLSCFNIGINKTNFNFDFIYADNGINFMGDCFNSDYCIIGGIVQ